MKQLLEAINHLHSNKVCHKDIKPENVMIDPETLKIKLIDFNVSQLTGGDHIMSHTGTHGFMAPEMANNKAFN